MNVEPPKTLVIIESIVYKSNGFAIGSKIVICLPIQKIMIPTFYRIHLEKKLT
jgi:hypothetical protein